MTLKQTHRSGFTVTELLVVISILVILAALIVASVGRAREAAYASVCMSNMKQVTSQHLTLCLENNGVIIHPYRTKVKGMGSSPRAWPMYHALLVSDNISPQSPAREINKETHSLTYLRCPTAYRLARPTMDKRTDWRKVNTYAMNGLLGSDFDPDSGKTPWIKGARLISDIENPGKLVMLIEKEASSNGVYGNGAGPWSPNHVFAKFHNGGFNVAFYDGHVERGKHGVFPINTKPGFKHGDEEFRSYWWGLSEQR